jgi:hypothetical protein
MKKFIPKFIKVLLKRLRLYWSRRYYFLAGVFAVDVPIHNISWVPDGFVVQKIAATGVRIVDNFCSADEAAGLMNTAAGLIGKSGADAVVNDVEASGVYAVAGDVDDPAVLGLLYRCSILFGVPYTHCKTIVMAASGPEGGSNNFAMHRPANLNGLQHAAMIFLSEESGEAVFAELNLAISSRVGRAVCWSRDSKTGQSLLLPKETTTDSAASCKWVVQFWFADKPVRQNSHDPLAAVQAAKGQPLSGSEAMPAGIWAPQDIDLEAVFGQPDKLKDLV